MRRTGQAPARPYRGNMARRKGHRRRVDGAGSATACQRSCSSACTTRAGRRWPPRCCSTSPPDASGSARRGRDPADEVNPAVVAAMAEVGVDICRELPEAPDRRRRPGGRRRRHDGVRRRLPGLPRQALRRLGARRPRRPAGRGGPADPRRDRPTRAPAPRRAGAGRPCDRQSTDAADGVDGVRRRRRRSTAPSTGPASRRSRRAHSPARASTSDTSRATSRNAVVDQRGRGIGSGDVVGLLQPRVGVHPGDREGRAAAS